MGLLSTKFKLFVRWPLGFLGHQKMFPNIFCYCSHRNSILFLVLFGINVMEHRHCLYVYVFMTLLLLIVVQFHRFLLKSMQAFSLDFNLRSHMKTHSQENYHICPYPECGKRYAHEYKLKNHISSTHQKVCNLLYRPCLDQDILIQTLWTFSIFDHKQGAKCPKCFINNHLLFLPNFGSLTLFKPILLCKPDWTLISYAHVYFLWTYLSLRFSLPINSNMLEELC